MDLIKLINFCTAKGTVNKMEKIAKNGRKYCK